MKQGRSGTPGKTIRSVETALSILEVVQQHEPVSLGGITETVDRPKSTVHHHVSTLCDAGYLERVDDGYQLSLKLLSLGGQVRERNQLYHLAKDYVNDLADQTGEQSRLIIEEDGLGVTIYQAVGEHGSVTSTHIGSSEDLYCTAAGKAFLAELSTEAVENYIKATEFVAYTDHTLRDPDTLREELDTIRSQGVAFDDEECYQGVRCVASAIGSQSGELLGAISVSGPVERMDDDRFKRDIPNQIQNVVGVVEINSAYSDWTDAMLD
jgi:DNA-binding IclR family transcriptional regulator